MDPLKQFQDQKKKAEQKVLIGGPLAVLSVGLFILFALDSPVLQGVLGLIFLGAMGVIIAGVIGYNKVVELFKHTFLKDKIAEWIDEGVYDPSSGLHESLIYQCEFLPPADRYHAEDYVRGKMDGVGFEMCDVKLEERRVEHTKNGTRTYYVPYFTGQFYVVDFNKNFDGALQVLETERPRSNRKYKKIKMESVQFNKIYKTYTTKDHTAFYIITPQMMTRMMTIEQNHPGNIGFSFIDNRMYVAVDNNRSVLDVQMFRPLDAARIEAFKKDFDLIKDVIHELKLNKNIFKEVS